MRKGSANTTVVVLAVIGSLVLLNVLGLRYFGRLDVTRDQVYSLSKASRDAVANLEDPITVTAYFSSDLPPQPAATARYVRDLLEEYRAAAKGKLNFEFIDPAAQETDADKAIKRDVKRDIFGNAFREPTPMERELASEGVQPVKLKVVEEDKEQFRLVYLAMVLRYGEKKEVLPLVQSTHTLEYDLTQLIRKMSRPKKPVIAILQGHEEPKLEDQLQALQRVLEQTYEVRALDLSAKDKVDPDVDALWVIGPKTAFKPNELKAIDQFLMQGKSAAFFLDSVQVDLKTFQPTEVNHGLAPLLATYGVTLGDKLVADARAFSLRGREQRGGFTFEVPVPYPFIPILQRLEGNSPITKGIAEVILPFTTEVTVKALEGATGTVLAKSSPKSWLEGKPYNTDPQRPWRNEDIKVDGPHPMVVQVVGKLKSHFAAEAPAANSSSAAAPLLAESNGESRIIVAGGSMGLWNDLLQSGGNQPLALNIADWLVLDPAMLAMRTRGMAEIPLQPELSAGLRNAVKYGAAVGLPLLLALVGLARYLMRESRRASVAV